MLSPTEHVKHPRELLFDIRNAYRAWFKSRPAYDQVNGDYVIDAINTTQFNDRMRSVSKFEVGFWNFYIPPRVGSSPAPFDVTYVPYEDRLVYEKHLYAVKCPTLDSLVGISPWLHKDIGFRLAYQLSWYLDKFVEVLGERVGLYANNDGDVSPSNISDVGTFVMQVLNVPAVVKFLFVACKDNNFDKFFEKDFNETVTMPKVCEVLVQYLDEQNL